MKTKEFALAVESVEAMLFSHALSFTKDVDDAKDLVQETLLKGIRFCEQFDPSTNIKSWLYVIMRNTYINSYRKMQSKFAVITTEDEITYAQLSKSATTNSAISGFTLGDIQKALNSINPLYSKPFQRYFEGYQYGEIAQELGIPLGTVKTRIHVARTELKRYLKMYRSDA